MTASTAVLKFNPEKMILHLTAREELLVSTPEELQSLCERVRDHLDRHAGGQPCYMIVDISRIVIQPELVPMYAEHMKQLHAGYVYPDGVARYGYAITRVTARAGYERMHGGDPNLFRTYEEACEYIDGLIAVNRSRLATPTLP